MIHAKAFRTVDASPEEVLDVLMELTSLERWHPRISGSNLRGSFHQDMDEDVGEASSSVDGSSATSSSNVEKHHRRDNSGSSKVTHVFHLDDGTDVTETIEQTDETHMKLEVTDGDFDNGSNIGCSRRNEWMNMKDFVVEVVVTSDYSDPLRKNRKTRVSLDAHYVPGRHDPVGYIVQSTIHKRQLKRQLESILNGLDEFAQTGLVSSAKLTHSHDRNHRYQQLMRHQQQHQHQQPRTAVQAY